MKSYPVIRMSKLRLFIQWVLPLVLFLTMPLHPIMRVFQNVPLENLPGDLAAHAAKHPLEKGFIDVTQEPYSLDATGKGDNADALSRAIQDAYWNNLALWFPSGTYRFSREIVCEQVDTPVKGAGVSLWKFAHLMVGDPRNRPTLKLDDGALKGGGVFVRFFFNFRAQGNKSDASRHYMSTLRGFILDMGENPGADALSMDGAQHCVIEDVDIKGRFHRGLIDPPGSGGSVTRLSVTGGRVGVLVSQYRPNVLLTGLTLTGQTETGIRITGSRGPVTVVGAEIRMDDASPRAVGISVENTTTAWGNQALDGGRADLICVDSRIESPGTALSIHRRGAFLTNLFIRAPVRMKGENARGEGIQVPDPANGWWRTPSLLVAYGSEKVHVVDGEPKDTSQGFLRQDGWLPGPPPADLTLRHVWTQTPVWIEGLDIRDFGATPDRMEDDDAPAIQKALDEGVRLRKPVLIPRGHFSLRSPIRIPSGATLFGAAKNSSVLQADPAWRPQEPTAMVRVEGAGVTLAEFALLGRYPSRDKGTESQSNLRYLDIAAPDALVRNVVLSLFSTFQKGPQPRFYHEPIVCCRGSASGRFYNLAWIDEVETGTVTERFAFLRLEDVQGPLRFYQADPEHITVAPAQIAISGTKDATFYATKYEGDNSIFDIRDSVGIALLGGSGNYELREGVDALLRLSRNKGLVIAGFTRKVQSAAHQRDVWILDQDRTVPGDGHIGFYK